MITPYKGVYYFEEFWRELVQGTLWKAYALANRVESAAIVWLAQKKIDEQPYTLPIGLAKTHTGTAIIMAFCTMRSGKAPA